MGSHKNLQIEQEEMWFSAPCGFTVCSGCVADAALARFIEVQADSPVCSFCGASSAADATAVLEYMSRCLRREWARPIDEYLHDAESPSGYAGTSYDLREVLEREYPVFENDDFEKFVFEAFSETEWCPLDFAAINEEEALRYGWRDLATTVKHRQRFLFLLDSDDKVDEGPGAEIRRGPELLEALADLIRKHGLVRSLEPTTALYRCRLHGMGKRYTTAADLGAPPDEKASQSRMSPAGISMLYVADDPETAFAETFDEKRTHTKGVTIATFYLTERCRIIDLSELPATPSIFEDAPETKLRRRELGFLAGFRADVGGHVERDGQEHIDYVPTQVVSEYLRYVFRDNDGQSIHGLAWESTKKPGTRSVALFFGNDRCTNGREPPRNAGELGVRLAGVDTRRLASRVGSGSLHSSR